MIAEQLAVARKRSWFRKRRGWAVVFAAMLAFAAWGLGFAFPGERAPLAVVFALPIALLAVTFGSKGGVVAGVGAMVLIVAWALPAGSAGVDVSGWASAAAMLILGALLGGAVDGLTASEQRAQQADDIRSRLEQTAQRHRVALEINDTLVQSVAVAKWALEAGEIGRALEVLEQTVDTGQRVATSIFTADRSAPSTMAGGAAAHAARADRPCS